MSARWTGSGRTWRDASRVPSRAGVRTAGDVVLEEHEQYISKPVYRDLREKILEAASAATTSQQDALKAALEKMGFSDLELFDPHKKVIEMIRDTQEEIKNAQTSNDAENLTLLQQKFIVLNELKKQFSKKLGDRIIY